MPGRWIPHVDLSAVWIYPLIHIIFFRYVERTKTNWRIYNRRLPGNWEYKWKLIAIPPLLFLFLLYFSSSFLLHLFSYLTLVPETDYSYSSAGYDAYLIDAQQQIMMCKKICSHWPVDPQLPMTNSLARHEKSNTTHLNNLNNSNSNGHGNGNNNNNSQSDQERIEYLTNVVNNLNVSLANIGNNKNGNSEQAVGSPPIPTIVQHEEYVKKFFGGGLFMTTLLDKLSNLLNQPLATNLILTGIVTRLAHFPFPLLYSYLLNKNLPLRPGIRSLWSVLINVSRFHIFYSILLFFRLSILYPMSSLILISVPILSSDTYPRHLKK